MASYGVIVVLFQPTSDFVANLSKVRAACPQVVAVDNSPAPKRQVYASFADDVAVLFNRNRGGLAGAYNRAAEILLARGCEVMFLLDQDSDVAPSFFASMMQAASGIRGPFLLGPRIHEVALGRCMPVIPPGKRFPKPVPVDGPIAGDPAALVPTLCIISSGSAISASAYRTLGPFREDYHIEYVDIEYSLRAHRRNVPVYMYLGETVRQTQGRIERHGRTFTTNHAAARRYYMARNSWHCLHEYRSLCGLHWLAGVMTLRQAMVVLRFDQHKLAKLAAMACGSLDGRLGRLGTFERRHPRLAAFCYRARDEGETAHGRKLSQIEHVADGNIVYWVRLDGALGAGQLRSALDRVQGKHPALRSLLRERPDGLFYESECAPEIPLRIVAQAGGNDFRRESRAELATPFAPGQPMLRAVWLRLHAGSDLLLVSSHRVCDGMSMLTIVREVLRCLHSGEPLIPYPALSRRDIVGDYQPPHPWKRRLAAASINGLARLIPRSHRAPDNRERFVEWRASRELTAALTERAKAEGVSVHAALLVALDRALLAALGQRKLPKWIENPVDIRRGRFPALKSDMILFAGGNFKLPTGEAPGVEFWQRARAVHEEVRRRVDRELRALPSQIHFSEMLRPPAKGQLQWIVRLGDALRMNGSWNRIAFSNLGNVTLDEPGAPFRVRELGIYVHSLTFRALCLVVFTLHGEMHFYCVGDEKCITASQMEKLKAAIARLLENEVGRGDTLYAMEAVSHRANS